MIRVYVVCEGRTEEMFVLRLLSEPFAEKGVYLYPSKLGRSGHKGGNVKAERICFDVRERLLKNKRAFCTTFFDFYALPENFPGKKDADRKRDVFSKAVCVQKALTQRINREIGDEPARRFIPYIQMYEFEGLLFSDPENLASGIDRSDLAPDFHLIRKAFSTPENINDGYETAPSRRITKLCPGYQKPSDGILAARTMGIEIIRRSCPLFNEWLLRLESLRDV
jgi:hypothetical protein